MLGSRQGLAALALANVVMAVPVPEADPQFDFALPSLPFALPTLGGDLPPLGLPSIGLPFTLPTGLPFTLPPFPVSVPATGIPPGTGTTGPTAPPGTGTGGSPAPTGGLRMVKKGVHVDAAAERRQYEQNVGKRAEGPVEERQFNLPFPLPTFPAGGLPFPLPTGLPGFSLPGGLPTLGLPSIGLPFSLPHGGGGSPTTTHKAPSGTAPSGTAPTTTRKAPSGTAPSGTAPTSRGPIGTGTGGSPAPTGAHRMIKKGVHIDAAAERRQYEQNVGKRAAQGPVEERQFNLPFPLPTFPAGGLPFPLPTLGLPFTFPAGGLPPFSLPAGGLPPFSFPGGNGGGKPTTTFKTTTRVSPPGTGTGGTTPTTTKKPSGTGPVGTAPTSSRPIGTGTAPTSKKPSGTAPIGTGATSRPVVTATVIPVPAKARRAL